MCFFFFSSRRRHTSFSRDWSSDVCSSDLDAQAILEDAVRQQQGIAVFEAARRRPFDIGLVAMTWLGVLAAVPFVRPFRWSRLMWTYLPPLLPVLGTVDGVVSC